MKTFSGNFFEDFELGQLLQHGTPRTITDGDMSLYIALSGSRYHLNCSNPAAEKAGFRAAPVDSLLAFHIAFGKTVPDISLNAVANLGYAETKFHEPVYSGDTISVRSKVIGLKENSNGKTGIVYVHSSATNQHDKLVIEWKRWVMVKKKDPNTRIEISVLPELAQWVDQDALPIPYELDLSTYSFIEGGSPHRFSDYQVGEVIHHVDGITIDESDHTLATKLYQNNAKVHFNALEMKNSPMGKRLMYGGHVISICRALAHNGLGNAQFVAAINGGTHANPTFAGDTLYAQSRILDSWIVSNEKGIGALRVQLIGCKNLATEQLPALKVEKNGRQAYHEQVVLDLDYTLLIPL